jgi:hypothetical protein
LFELDHAGNVIMAHWFTPKICVESGSQILTLGSKEKIPGESLSGIFSLFF